MSKATKKGSSAPALDPATMTEDELRAYVDKLEKALTLSQPKSVTPEKPWNDGEKRWVNIPKTPTNDVLTINGRPYIGRMLVAKETWDTICEMHQRAVRSEMARMEARGNLVPPHQLAADDVSSRQQPLTIANL